MKARLLRRARAASVLNKKLERIQMDLNNIPKYKGKAAFMDKIISARIHSHNLATNLLLDANE